MKGKSSTKKENDECKTQIKYVCANKSSRYKASTIKSKETLNC